MAEVPKVVPVNFSFEEAECRRLWEIREGFDAIIMAKAGPGSVSVGEDVAVPVEKLGAVLSDFNQLFDRWGYHEAVVFGHALSGNIHFTLLQNFGDPENVRRFKGLVEDLVEIVVDKYDGSLKAEHGTGHCMAPFVEREWGKSIFGIMKEIKALFDPAGILNRGVIFTDNPVAYVTHLKRHALVDPTVDSCVECGYCEKVCVSHGLTVSARQRIVLLRNLAWLEKSGEDPGFVKELKRDIPYLVMDTCAACGRCTTICPSGIKIPDYIKNLRAGRLNPVSRFVGRQTAGHVSKAAFVARAGLSVASGILRLTGEGFVRKCFNIFRDFPRPNAHRWISRLPLPAKALSLGNKPAAADMPSEVIYFPSCINRIMGVDSKTPGRKNSSPWCGSCARGPGFESNAPKIRRTFAAASPSRRKDMKRRPENVKRSWAAPF